MSNINPHDAAYHGLLRDILENGVDKGDRTGTGTRSLFGAQLKFDLRKGFPLIATKKLFTRGIIHELLWMISGSTNIKYLQDNGVKIWDEWSDANGELGPVYGQQWRKWYAGTRVEDDGKNTYVSPKYIDQLGEVIERIKTNPNCRRLIVSAWNPRDIEASALPPCHCFFQFNVEGNMLNLQLYQRSCDVFLGVPFNIASYALLLSMVARVTGLSPGVFTHTYGDVHIYNNHFDQVREQLSREIKYPPAFLALAMDRDIKSIDDFTFDDIRFEGYSCDAPIKAEVSV